ncbi:MAG: group III truncated hemoglobin [Chitinophagaceae bacterium]
MSSISPNPSVKIDIASEQDIILLVQNFYRYVNANHILRPYFQNVNWDQHLPIMYAFWSNTLLYKGGYHGNPMKAHTQLHLRMPMTAEVFDQWVHLFIYTVDELFEGVVATLAKQRATSIAVVMRMKIINGYMASEPC